MTSKRMRISTRSSALLLFTIICLQTALTVGLLSNNFTALYSSDRDASNTEILYENDDQSPLQDFDIEYYEEKYPAYVKSDVPEGSFIEDNGVWYKGDPGVHTSDGGFEINYILGTLPIGYDTPVDTLVQQAIANDLDWIGFTNMDGIRIHGDIIKLILELAGISIPDFIFDLIMGDDEALLIKADYKELYGAIEQARYDYGDQIEIFMGCEKTVGTIADIEQTDIATALGLGQKVQCLVPYHPDYEVRFIEDIIDSVLELPAVLNALEGAYGLSYEKGIGLLSPNIGALGSFEDFLWEDADFQTLTEADVYTGVVSVVQDKVSSFIEYSQNPSGYNWDKSIDNGHTVFAAAGSDNLIKQEDAPGGPGSITKTYVKAWEPGYTGIMRGFKYGRVFTAQNNIISGMDIEMRDDYNHIAYMGDTMVSYGNQTLRVKLNNNTNIDHVDVISNYGTSSGFTRLKVFDSDDYEPYGDDGIRMDYLIDHSDEDYFIRLEGVAESGDRFFSAPIYYEKSNRIFPTINVTSPENDNYVTNDAGLRLEWEDSDSLRQIDVDVWHDNYFEPTSETGSPDFNGQAGGQQDWFETSNYLEDGWNTIRLMGSNWIGDTALTVLHVYCNKDQPVVNIDSPLNETYWPSGDITVSWTGTTVGGKWVNNYSIWVDMDSPEKLDNETTSYDLTGLADGKHTIHVMINQSGNDKKFTANSTIYVDTQSPSFTFNTPVSEGAVYNENKTVPSLNVSFIPYDMDSAIGGPDYAQIRLYKDLNYNGVHDRSTELYESSVLEGAEGVEWNYSVPWEDGRYLVNITVFDLAGNWYSEERNFSLDFYKPILGVPLAYYSNTELVELSWTQFDTASSIDTAVLTLSNGSSYKFNEAQNETTIRFNDEGVYSFDLVANDTEGHKVKRESEIYVDKNNPIIYTVWIEDEFFTRYSNYFRVGITIHDTISGVNNFTLHYSLYNDPLQKTDYAITKISVSSAKISVEIPYEKIDSHLSQNQVNLSFYFDVYDKVGYNSQTPEFEHIIQYQTGTYGDGLTIIEIFIIIGSITLAGVIGYFVIKKVKMRRDFGDAAKYY